MSAVRRAARTSLTTLLAAACVAAAAGCGGGPPTERVRAEAAEVCARHAGALPAPPPRDANPARVDADAVALIGAVNATDAGLDAIGAGGSNGDRIRDLREGALDVRAAANAVRLAALDEDYRGLEAAARQGREGFTRIDGAASALGAAECSGDSLGRPLFDALVAVVAADAAEAMPTGDFPTDLNRACAALPRDVTLPARPARGPEAQGRAIRLRQQVQAFTTAVRALRPATGEQRDARRAALSDLDRVQERLLVYSESVAVRDQESARLAAAEVAALTARARRRLAAVGGDACGS